MNASPLAAALRLIAAGTALTIALPVAAQDAVILKSGLTREGKITGVSGGNVRLQIGGGGSTGIPLAEIREVRMDAPPEFDAASRRLASGDAAGAAGDLQKISDNFSGLPAPWAKRAAALLGDAKLAAGDKEGAAAAYDKLSETYPDSTALANLGRARLAVEAGRYDEAETLLGPVLQGADEIALPAEDGPALSQAFYLEGRVKEAAGDNQAALAGYLKASALFPFDKNAAADAARRADALRAEHAGLIAP
jgi:tetratricopeptide (TPR) repeat protein